MTPDDDTLVVLSRTERRRRARLRALPTWGETDDATQTRRTALIKQLARSAGFSRVGVAHAQPLDEERARLEAWLAAGMHGDMAWLADDVARRCDPGRVVAGARAVVVLALDYDSAAPHTRDLDLAGSDRGWLSRYAWGTDYHVIMEQRLKALTESVRARLGPELGTDFRGAGQRAGPFRAAGDFRWSVDYGPVLERAWAQRAGLGWQGKHTLLIHPQHGSYFFLATVVTSIPLDADAPAVDQCGSCTACLDACPTGAIVEPWVVDARKCISHATIEANLPPAGASAEGPSAGLQTQVGDHVFGCDLCQESCPWNRFSRPAGEPAFEPRPGNVAPHLAGLAELDAAAFAARFAQSAVKRRGLEGMRFNVEAVRAGRRRDT
ncbi:MAG: tRNA epoxyqueuosine(34) reductase QueG [Myxococcales bacterium]|nr:tRNA epoxyqueuosine(34) reductase QueG [Myxococcales bacterium]